MIGEFRINSIVLNNRYTQIIDLPSDSIILDIVKIDKMGYSIYKLLYKHASLSSNLSRYNIQFINIDMSYSLSSSYNYLGTITENDYSTGSYLNTFSVFWNRILSDVEKREMKLEYLID